MPRLRKRSRKSNPPKATPPEEETWYQIRKIIDERIKNKRTEYLVDWEDNIDTGESYDPSWSVEVTDEARKEWEDSKQQLDDDQASRPASAQSQESQPPRPANWRQLQRAESTGLAGRLSRGLDEEDRPSKRQRLEPRLTRSEEPVPSITSSYSADTPTDASSPAYLEPTSSRPPQQITVEIKRDPNFDAHEYLGVNNTQSSSNSYESVVALEQQDERAEFASQLTQSAVLDSQEVPGPAVLGVSRPSNNESGSQVIHDQGTASVVIPDSYEDSGASIEYSSGRPLESAPQPSRISIASLLEAPQDTTSTELDIPSHQLAQGRASLSLGSRAPSIDSSPDGPNRHRNSLIIPQSSARAASTTHSIGQIFLTQVRLEPPVPIPTSSLPSQVPETSVDSSTTSSSKDHRSKASSGSGTVSSLRASQAAQITSQESPRPAQPAMDSETPSASSVPSGVSAVDQLRSLVDFGSLEEPPKDHLESQTQEGIPVPNPTSQSESHNGAPLAAVNLDLEPVTGPEAELQSKELDELMVNANEMEAGEHAQESGSLMETPVRSAVDFLTELVDMGLTQASHSASETLIPDRPKDVQNTTVSPSDIIGPAETETMAIPIELMPSLISESRENVEEVPAMTELPDPTLTHHLVTLPFHASMRPLYDDTLLEHRKDITEFGDVFSNEIYTEPEKRLVESIDQLFNTLRNICDYPQDGMGMDVVPAKQLGRYLWDANPKFNMIYELLNGLQEATSVLIIARSEELLRLLSKVTEALELQCSSDAISIPTQSEQEGNGRVTLALYTENINPLTFDVVVGFDHGFHTSPMAQALSSAEKSPLVLILVTTHSLDHIDLQVPKEASPLERRNMLLSGIVRARRLICDPDQGYLEPHQLARNFVNYLNGETQSIPDVQVPIPDDVLDVYMSSQPRSQWQPESSLQTAEQGNNRKRRIEDETNSDDAKRIRTDVSNEISPAVNGPPLSDEVAKLLQDASPIDLEAAAGGRVSVPIKVLDVLAQQTAEYERKLAATNLEAEYKGIIAGLEARVKEYERTSHRIYEAHRAALSDRTAFEAEKRTAEAALQTEKGLALKNVERAQKRSTELEEELRRIAEGSDQGVIALDGKLKEEEEKVLNLEKRLQNAQKDAEYARSLYQDASTSATAMRAEVVELRQQQEELLKKASDNLAKVHEIQARSSAQEHLRQIADLQTQNKGMQVELGQLREENRQLKNGRQTRQTSVPPTPRMGVMSPRGGRPLGGSTSRGTSPAPGAPFDAVPGMQFLTPQAGNSRFSHLKE